MSLTGVVEPFQSSASLLMNSFHNLMLRVGIESSSFHISRKSLRYTCGIQKSQGDINLNHHGIGLLAWLTFSREERGVD